jgi:hypothetical protein
MADTTDERLKELGIENVANIKTGGPQKAQPASSTYKNTATGDSKLMFEPDAELVDLPSHGYLYKNITDDPDIIERGQIRIRPMTVHEEKILTTARLVKTGQALDLIFRNCIKSRIDPGEMLSSDRVFVMLWLRSISYGNIYRFFVNTQDPASQIGKFEVEVDLSNHPIKEMEDPEIKEPFKTTLPSGFEITYRLPRGKDEIEIIKMNNQPKGITDTDETIVKRLSSIIIEAKRKDGSIIPQTQYDSFVDSLVTRDASAFRKAIDNVDCSVEQISVTDPSTGYSWDMELPITESFFSVSDN